MNENRSFASLEPTLLARKGGAKPAMRPQVAPTFNAQPLPPIEDLGWNDMGEAEGDEAYEQEPEVLQLAPAGGKPAVRQHIEAIAAHLARAGRNDNANPHASAPKVAPADRRRAAFTLRLDSERHLKLRLASTIKNRSAQQIVTEALDRLLDAMPELDSLASQLRKKR
jgi:hypothetical protein